MCLDYCWMLNIFHDTLPKKATLFQTICPWCSISIMFSSFHNSVYTSIAKSKILKLDGFHLESFLIKILTIFASLTLENMNEEKANTSASHHFQNGAKA